MKLRKKNTKTRSKKDKIIDIIFSLANGMPDSIADEAKYVYWIKRIIDFIESELPNSDKYQRKVQLLKGMIDKKGDLNELSWIVGPTVIDILKDLMFYYDIDYDTDFNIEFHPRVKEVSLDLFKNKHYSEAIFEAIKALNNYVKEKANIIDKDLSFAMALAFNENKPIIKLNKLENQSEKDEQEGFKLLFMGAMKGIRNPRGHETYKLEDKNIALEYLGFISLLFRKAEEGRLE